MRTMILAVAGGLALAASAHATPKPTATELGVAPPVELVRDGCGRGWHRTHWRDQWAIGSGATAFQTKVVTVPVTVTMAGARGGTIRSQIGAPYSLAGVGVINRSDR